MPYVEGEEIKASKILEITEKRLWLYLNSALLKAGREIAKPSKYPTFTFFFQFAYADAYFKILSSISGPDVSSEETLEQLLEVMWHITTLNNMAQRRVQEYERSTRETTG